MTHFSEQVRTGESDYVDLAHPYQTAEQVAAKLDRLGRGADGMSGRVDLTQVPIPDRVEEEAFIDATVESQAPVPQGPGKLPPGSILGRLETGVRQLPVMGRFALAGLAFDSSVYGLCARGWEAAPGALIVTGIGALVLKGVGESVRTIHARNLLAAEEADARAITEAARPLRAKDLEGHDEFADLFPDAEPSGALWRSMRLARRVTVELATTLSSEALTAERVRRLRNEISRRTQKGADLVVMQDAPLTSARAKSRYAKRWQANEDKLQAAKEKLMALDWRHNYADNLADEE